MLGQLYDLVSSWLGNKVQIRQFSSTNCSTFHFLCILASEQGICVCIANAHNYFKFFISNVKMFDTGKVGASGVSMIGS